MSETLNLGFPGCLIEDFPGEMPAALASVDRILGALGDVSFDALERHSPALKDNDWANYLRCSTARMVHAAGALRRAGVSGGRMLDYGAYFGNFAGMFADLGFAVDAIDGFRAYADSLHGPLAVMRNRGITILDFADQRRDLSGLPADGYDVILCAGVIEHMPHTPLGLLTALNRVLKPGGHLIIDTPNLAHLYKRQALARGESVWPPLGAQFYSPIPYEGHHREYTAAEIVWMLHEVGHDVMSIELYSYSCYEQPELRGRDVSNFWRMVADPTQREYITALSRRGELAVPSAPAPDWQSILVEAEPHWQSGRPSERPAEPDVLVAVEPLLLRLQAEVAERDRQIVERDRTLSGLREVDARTREEAVARVTERDETIDRLNCRIVDLNDELGALRGKVQDGIGARLQHVWRQLIGK